LIRILENKVISELGKYDLQVADTDTSVVFRVFLRLLGGLDLGFSVSCHPKMSQRTLSFVQIERLSFNLHKSIFTI